MTRIAPASCGLLVFLLAACAAPVRTNVLVVTLDTTRADHLGCYGNTTVQTPNLDRIAAEGVRFENATAAVPITAPSHSTIMTGLYPIGHGLRDNGLFVLGKGRETLAERLKARGYATAAAVGSFPLDSRFGLDQGFDLYDDRFDAGSSEPAGAGHPRSGLYFDERRAGLVNEAALPWLEAHHDQPFFLWVHYFDAHQPHEPPPPYDQLYADDLYDGEIAYADESFGELLEALERHGVLDRTIVVVCADHGEGLGEHGETTHSMLLYQGTLRVPLLVRLPGSPGGRVVRQRVGTVDVTPTLLELLGLPLPEGLHGRSLASLVRGDAPDRPDEERLLYAETLSPRLVNGWAELRALSLGSRKYVFGPEPELFDLERDPREEHDLAAAEPDRAASMKARLAAFMEQNALPNSDAAVPVDEETRQRLMALGYLPSAAGSATVEELLRDGGVDPHDRIGDISGVSIAKNMLYQGRPLEAREVLTPMVEHDPENPSYRELLAMADLALGLVDEAAAQVAVMRRVRGGTGMSEALALQLVSSLYQNERREEALTLLRELQEAQPSAAGQYLLALLLKASGDEVGRAAALAKTLALDPSHAGARVDAAIDLARAGRRAEARRELDDVAGDNPYDARAIYNLGTFHVEEGEMEEASACFARAVLLEPRYLKARLALTVVQLELGDRADAERSLAELERMAPGSEEARQARSLFAPEGA